MMQKTEGEENNTSNIYFRSSKAFKQRIKSLQSVKNIVTFRCYVDEPKKYWLEHKKEQNFSSNNRTYVYVDVPKKILTFSSLTKNLSSPVQKKKKEANVIISVYLHLTECY